jgi:hypothetical protein
LQKDGKSSEKTENWGSDKISDADLNERITDVTLAPVMPVPGTDVSTALDMTH